MDSSREYCSEEPMHRTRCVRRSAVLSALLAAGAFLLPGCAGPLVLERQVLGYDEVAKRLDEQLLLLNIARVANGEGVHFTATSSIAATFDWTTTVGVGGSSTPRPRRTSST